MINATMSKKLHLLHLNSAQKIKLINKNKKQTLFSPKSGLIILLKTN